MRAPLPTFSPEPFGGRVVDQAFNGENVEVDLVANLQRIAAVDEDDRAVGEHDRSAC